MASPFEPNALHDALALGEGAYESLLERAMSQYEEGAFDEAKVILAGLRALRPDDARPPKVLGSIAILEGRTAQAEALFALAHHLHPDDPYVLVALAELRLGAYRIEQALPLLQRLFELDPQAQHPATQRGRFLAKQAYERITGE
jgi:predicted Zn-dependent protease